MIEKRKNLAWLILARLVVVSLFLASITYFNIRQPNFFPDEMLQAVTLLIIVTYCFSILSLVAFRLPLAAIDAVGYLQIIWEISFVSILLVITGGISSTYAFFYNLAIINASFLFGRREAIYTASLCGIIYGALIDLHYFGRLENLGLARSIGDLYGPNYVISIIFTNLLAFILTAILTGYLAERARKSETALKVKEIDYQELERLNSLIVSTLDSGLVTVNSEGKVRVFNRYAAELTGIDQDKAYNLPLDNVFPGLALDNLPGNKDNNEFIFNNAGGKRILGVKSAPLQDRDGNVLGAIIAFQDKTGIRDMEKRLKKADRLAAIGELSARIAHEVRNPLASISGSVQLISESRMVPENDRKLLEIVLRETSRLDKMVNEFLQYARPVPPDMNWFSLKPLINETIVLLRGDNRFAAVTMTDTTSESLIIFADYSQFKQVVWNLMLNAAEAMPTGGTIIISSHVAANRGILPVKADTMIEMSIADSGAGISEKNMHLLFEPFFTTKSGGTGLGLATVYRIIEAHSGVISVESNVGNGSCFRISLPLPEKQLRGENLLPDSDQGASRGRE
jgi:two-component system sensor histidine kinase PilS (NtrC family)